MSNQTGKPDRWTEEQWRAITDRGRNLLVAAAAGSGKTSVLVERIIRRITDPADPVGVDRLLVVTFTNAAAAEMRQRIGDALRKAIEAQPSSGHLRRQLALLPRAAITTLHSFCLGLLRQYYYLVDLDPQFRIADPLEAELLRQDVLDAMMETWYEQDEAFRRLAEVMVDGQDDAELAATLMRLYHFSRSHPDPNRWLQEAAAMFDVPEGASLSAVPWTEPLLAAIRTALGGVRTALKKAAALAASPEGPAAYLPLLEQEAAAVERAIAACGEGWEAAEAAVRAVSFAALPRTKDADPAVKEQVQSLRNAAKKKMASVLDEYFSLDAAGYLGDLRRLAPLMQTLARLVGEYEEAYRREKRARSLLDFDDLEHLALRVLAQRDEAGGLTPSDVARQLRDQFVEVLVDEYQDINVVQETILQLVSRDGSDGRPPNRFMVGDVKQSIYRFRLAEPRLFLAKYRTYTRAGEAAEETPPGAPLTSSPAAAGNPSAESGARIDLAANFRSRREVVDAVNYLFRQIMTPGVGELAYDRSAELICRAGYPEWTADSLDVEVHLLDRSGVGQAVENGAEGASAGHGESAGAGEEAAAGDSGGAEESVARLEGRLIARRIRQWMEPGEGGQPLLVYDREQGGLRPLAYRDIVILLRATAGWAQPVMEELRAAGIPVYADQDEGYFAAAEVDVMLSLLRVIDNPRQDIPLAAVLRSPIVGLNEEELAAIRARHPSVPFHQAVFACAAEDEPESSFSAAPRLRRFLARLETWRTQARRGPVAELIARIYRETGYADYVAALENGSKRQANLRLLYDRARQYEGASYRGLFRFLRFLDRLKETGGDLGEARTVGEGEDVVRLMTIHKSKGLEFPVVFVAGLGKAFNTADERSRFLLHKDLGFGPQVIDPELRVRYPSLASLSIRQQLRREMLAEEMRVLYVALTRAREKLVLVGSCRDLAKAAASWCDQAGDGETLADEDLVQAACYLDWIGRALVRHPHAKLLRNLADAQGADGRVRTLPDPSRWAYQLWLPADLPASDGGADSDEEVWQRILRLEPMDGQPRDGRSRELISRALAWRYPHEPASRVAAKWTVSDLKRREAESGGDGETAAWPQSGPMPVKLPKITEKPRFLSQAQQQAAARVSFSAAEIGTFTHTVLQHLDVTRPLDAADLKEQLARLVEQQYLTAEQASQVNLAGIAAFFRSELGRRIRQAPRLHRELPFTLAYPASRLGLEADGLDGERAIVQGVIDCLVEEADGTLVLIDFKTDAVPDSRAVTALTERYRPQVRLYREAVETIWRKRVREAYLVFLAAGTAVPVEDT